MKKVGFIGWRGMVGSVLMQRMQEEKDFEKAFTPYFYSTSQAGLKGPEVNGQQTTLENAFDIESLKELDIVLTCQGGDYTNEVYPKLKESGWQGYWIDAASSLRMNEDSLIVLDPINKKSIDQALNQGIKNYVGGNCTVSLMLMALGGLFEQDLVEWVSSMTYQAASGAGAQNMREMLEQMLYLSEQSKTVIRDASSNILELDQLITELTKTKEFPKKHFGAALTTSLIPWIDKEMPNGQSKEEWKGAQEGNKILGHQGIKIPIDGTCVRIASLRCHSQAFTIKLKKDIDISEVEELIKTHNPWVKYVENQKQQTIDELCPTSVSGTLDIAIGRVRKMNLGKDFINAFSVGDQLLWGAAEPLRRMLNILLAQT